MDEASCMDIERQAARVLIVCKVDCQTSHPQGGRLSHCS